MSENNLGENQIPSESDLSRHSGYLLDGRWRVLPAENRVIGPDTDRRIADKYMRVLVHLCDHPTVVTREELLQAVWPDTVVVEEVLTRAVSELRKIFGDDPRASHFIETIPKRGYRLLVPVTPLPAQAVTTPTGPRLWTGWRPRVAPLLGMAAAVVAGVAFWMIVLDARIHRSDQPGPAPSLLQLTSLKGVEEYPTLSPEGTRLAFAWEGDEKTPTGIFVLPLGQDTPLALTPPHGHYAYPAWSPDGKFVAYSRVAGQDPGLFQVPAGGGTEKLLVPVREGRPSITPDFSPDGKTLVYAAPMGTQQGWHLETLDLQEGRTAPLTRDLPTGTWEPPAAVLARRGHGSLHTHPGRAAGAGADPSRRGGACSHWIRASGASGISTGCPMAASCWSRPMTACGGWMRGTDRGSLSRPTAG